MMRQILQKVWKQSIWCGAASRRSGTTCTFLDLRAFFYFALGHTDLNVRSKGSSRSLLTRSLSLPNFIKISFIVRDGIPWRGMSGGGDHDVQRILLFYMAMVINIWTTRKAVLASWQKNRQQPVWSLCTRDGIEHFAPRWNVFFKIKDTLP